MERGYVKLWRKTLDSGLLQSPTAWQVFGWILLNATRTKRRLIVGGQIFELEPGDYVASVASLSESLKLSPKQIRTALNLLEKLEILAIKGTNKGSVFSLVKWECYQEGWQTEGQTNGQIDGKQRANGGQAEGKPLKKQEIKNINIPPILSSLRSESMSPVGDPACTPEKPKRASSASVSRKPPTPDEVQAYCEERGNGLDAERFCDYYAAQGWRLANGQPLKDWKAAVRNWELRARERPKAAQVFFSGQKSMTDAERRQAHNDEVCRQVSAELDAMGGPF